MAESKEVGKADTKRDGAEAGKPRRIMVDMSATLLHHGHIRLLKAAKAYGWVVVALTEDGEIRSRKGYDPELSYEERREILEAIRYVDEVVPSPWLLDDEFLDRHRVDLLVHGSDNRNAVEPDRTLVLPRTPGISSTGLRARVLQGVVARLEAGEKD